MDQPGAPGASEKRSYDETHVRPLTAALAGSFPSRRILSVNAAIRNESQACVDARLAGEALVDHAEVPDALRDERWSNLLDVLQRDANACHADALAKNKDLQDALTSHLAATGLLSTQLGMPPRVRAVEAYLAQQGRRMGCFRLHLNAASRAPPSEQVCLHLTRHTRPTS